MVWQSVLGCGVFIGLAWVMSENRRRVNLRLLGTGVLLSFAAALALMKIPVMRDGFMLLNHMVAALQAATTAGTSFVFGYLGGAQLPFVETFPGSSFILAFQALPMVLLMSALSSLLFFWKLMPAVVRAISWGLRKTMRIGGAEGLSNAVNVFVGMVGDPLFIRPYIGRMTRSELFSVMTYALCGFANPGSLGIMIGGMSTMAPDRRTEIVELGLRSIVSGTLTSCMIGSIVGVVGA